jgi:hypothetical protein
VPKLSAFWFRLNKGLGYGVTAFSKEDAEQLLSSFGYPRDREVVTDVVEGITHAQLEQNHVVPNAGPIIVRGVWFPNHSFSR